MRAETAIGESPASVRLRPPRSRNRFSASLEGRSILLLGAGKVSEQAARNLRSRGAEIALVANSKTERERIGEEPLTSTSSMMPRRTRRGSGGSTAATASPARRTAEAVRSGRLLFVDLAVPRDLDPAIRELDGCYLYDIDDLEQIVVETMSLRRREAERAETIVAAEAEKFHEWHASLDVVPAIASLRARAEEIREAELQKAESLLERLDDSQRRAVEAVTAQIVNKLLHQPTVRMKQAAVSADGVLYAEAVRHLFGLGEDER